MRRLVLWIFVCGFLAGCTTAVKIEPQANFTSIPVDPLPAAQAPQPAQPQQVDPPAVEATPTSSASLPTDTSAPTPSPEGPTPTARPTLAPDAWKDLPVLPQLSPHALAVIKEGLRRGNNPRAFSKIGDCESRTTWFLGDFDMGPKFYALGSYESDLQPVVDYYKGSFNRLSLAAKPGFTSASVMSLLWTDPQACEKNETPLACEYRLNKPVLAFIMLGTNDASNPKTFEGHMRKIIEYSLSQGVLPVLGTKADNVEGDESINATIARLAYAYDIPLWNFWRAAQGLPDHGLQSDGQHLTFGPTRFDDPANLENAWPVRNLGALQILKMVMDQTP